MSEIIVALDVASAGDAHALAAELGPDAEFYKVGLELFTRAGPSVVEDLRGGGKRVFLDLKLHDIPSTVARAVEAAADLGADLLTVHAAGGPAMLKAAADAAGDRIGLLGVTVLTSLSPSDVEAVWGRELRSLRDEVLRLAALVRSAGLRGVVASANEVEALRRTLGPDLLIATPGIRLPGDEPHDQSRIATPDAAVRAGADFLIVGRSVTRAEHPRQALERVKARVREAMLGAGA